MLKNYITTALRAVQRNPIYFLINLTGLTVGITCALLIMLFVNHERSYDQFHDNKDRLYRINYDMVMGGNQTISPSVPIFVAPYLKRLFPEIEDATRFRLTYNPVSIRSQGDRMFEENKFAYADSNFFKLLNFKAIQGNLATALNRPKTLVISSSMAKKYFGDQDPVGQSLIVGSNTPYEVTAVMEDIPDNSHFTFDLVTSIYTMEDVDEQSIHWNNPEYTTFILLKNNVDLANLKTKINDWVIPPDQRRAGDNSLTLPLEPLSEVHFNTHVFNFRNTLAVTDIKYLYIFSAIAALLLLIACINYINLSTARAATRAKEVGIRKTSGANFKQLIFQYLTESFLLLLPAVILSAVATNLLIPLVNFMMNKKIQMNFLESNFLFTILAGWIVLSLLAGFYPALVLSRFKPIAVLKGKSVMVEGLSLRKALVIVQFSISAILIVGTLIVVAQLRFMQSKKLGLDKESTLFIRSNVDLNPSLQTFIQKLKTLPGVENASGTTRSPFETVVGHGFNLSPNPKSEGWVVVGGIAADQEYIETMGMQLLAGRNFDPTKVKDTINEFIVNEAFLRDFNISQEEAIGKQVTLGIVINRGPGTIIGVVKDFHITSLHQRIQPVVLFNNPEWIVGTVVRLSKGNPQPALQQMENEWRALVPNRPFNYTFLDDQYDALYRTEQRLSSLAGIFSTIAVMVACLGLFGLASFTSMQRAKEISIRKVLGATTPRIILLLSASYIKLLLISFVLASPISYLLLAQWLENFAFQIVISPLYFIIALAVLFAVSLLTVGYQSYKASSANPVNNLRLE